MLVDIWAGINPGWFDEGWHVEHWEQIDPDEERIIKHKSRHRSFRTRKLNDNN